MDSRHCRWNLAWSASAKYDLLEPRPYNPLRAGFTQVHDTEIWRFGSCKPTGWCTHAIIWNRFIAHKQRARVGHGVQCDWNCALLCSQDFCIGLHWPLADVQDSSIDFNGADLWWGVALLVCKLAKCWKNKTRNHARKPHQMQRV